MVFDIYTKLYKSIPGSIFIYFWTFNGQKQSPMNGAGKTGQPY